jgi:aspartyl-tRNA(Asn)/glutamyl-tRNA(Gln) amidotransferase subunit A
VLRAEFDKLMRGYDALIALSGHELPLRFDDPETPKAYERHSRMPFNVTGTPALAVPTGFSTEGLPLGMQIAGKAFDEAMLYRIAWHYGEATAWTSRHPMEIAA